MSRGSIISILKKYSYNLDEKENPIAVAACLKKLGSVFIESENPVTEVFFDTFDWRLFNAQELIFTCTRGRASEVQICDTGGDRIIATFPGALRSGFAVDFPEGHVRNFVTARIDVRRLLPRLRLVSRQSAITVRDSEEKIVLRISVRRCRAHSPGSGGDAFPMGTYLTVEPVRGYNKVAAAARALIESHFHPPADCAPRHIEGLHAIGVTPGDYSSRLSLDLNPAMGAADAARFIHLTLLDTMVRNEDGTARNLDPEFLHDFRVAIRRTRSALGQLDKAVLPATIVAKAKEDFRWVGRQTNAMRDLDVYLIDYPALQARLHDSYKAHLEPFRDHLAARSQKEARRVANMIRGRRYRQIRDDWRAYLTKGTLADPSAPDADTPVKALADRRLWKTYRRVMKDGKAIDDNSPAEALHNLRIHCKKLRYLLEFFQSLYPAKEIGGLIKSLKTFQNVLGDFQDAEIQSQAILGFGRDMAAEMAVPVETQMAMGMVAESILLRQQVARDAFGYRFDAFSRPAVKASFRTLLNRPE